jgi:hypothetical protein
MNAEERQHAITQLQRDRDAALRGQLTGLVLTGAPWRVVQREFVDFQAALEKGDRLPSLDCLASRRRAVSWRVRRWWRRQSALTALRSGGPLTQGEPRTDGGRSAGLETRIGPVGR